MSRREVLSGVLLLYSLDAFIKKYMKQHLKEGQPKKALKGKIILERLDNKGAALGFMKDKSRLVRLGSAGVLALMGARLYKVSGEQGRSIETAALLLMTAGGLGNVSDRISQGYVDDYLRIPCKNKDISRIVFNLADLYVVFGAGLSAAAAVLEN